MADAPSSSRSGSSTAACHARPDQRPDADRDPPPARRAHRSGIREARARWRNAAARAASRAHERREHGQRPAEPEQPAKETQLDAELRTFRLAFSACVQLRGRLADVAEPIALRMVDERVQSRRAGFSNAARRGRRSAAAVAPHAPRTPSVRRDRRAGNPATRRRDGGKDALRASAIPIVAAAAVIGIALRRGAPSDDEPGGEYDERFVRRERPELVPAAVTTPSARARVVAEYSDRQQQKPLVG